MSLSSRSTGWAVDVRFLRRVLFGWLAWRLLGPDSPPRYAALQRHPLLLPGRTVFAGDREVFVREAGPADGPVLVLLHGLGLDSMLAWYRVIPLLSDRLRVVVVDLHGHASVAGYSMGGAVAQELARRHPHLVDRMMLVATLAYHPPVWRWSRVAVGVLGRALERVSRVEVSWVWYRYLLWVGAADASDERWLWESRMNRDPELQYRSMFALLHFDSRAWLGRVDIPVLVVIPGADQLVLPAWQREMASLLQHSKVVEIPGARHELPMTHADRLADTIREFTPNDQ